MEYHKAYKALPEAKVKIYKQTTSSGLFYIWSLLLGFRVSNYILENPYFKAFIRGEKTPDFTI